MHLKIADESDNQRLIDFFKTSPIKGWMQLQANRSPDYFSPYKINSDRFLTYILQNEEPRIISPQSAPLGDREGLGAQTKSARGTGTAKEEIFGTASFVGKNVLIGEEAQNVIFACDLRISSLRRATLEWSKHFLPTLKEAQVALQAQSIFAIINKTEALALNAFLRPRIRRPHFPVYHYFRGLGGVSIHGRFPWAKRIVSSLRIKHFTTHTEDALWNYLYQRNLRKELSPFTSKEQIEEHFQSNDTLDKSNFLIASDSRDNIVGCTLPWSPLRFMDLVPLDYDPRAQNFRQFLKFADTLGWAHRLTRPKSRSHQEDSLNIKFLNYHFADSHYIHEALLDAAFAGCQKQEFLFYMRDENEIHLKRPRYWIGTEIPYGLYYLNFQENELPPFFTQRNRRIVNVDHPLLG